MFEQGFNSLLATNPGVMVQLGGFPFAREDAQTGVWPVQVPEEATLPNVAFSVVGRQSVNSVQGTSRLVMKRVQVNSRGRHYADAKNLQDAFQFGVAVKRDFQRAFAQRVIQLHLCRKNFAQLRLQIGDVRIPVAAGPGA